MFLSRLFRKRHVREKKCYHLPPTQNPPNEARGNSATNRRQDSRPSTDASWAARDQNGISAAGPESAFNFCVVLPTSRRRLSICDLPDEVLLRIFSYLDPLDPSFNHLMLSCKRLLRVAKDPSLYHVTTLKVPPNGMFSFSILQRVLDVSGTALIQMDFAGCEDVTDYALYCITTRCRNLKYLNLSGCKQITNAGLRVIGNFLRSLQRVDVSCCPFITCAGVVQVFKMLGETITFINLNDCLGFREDPHKLVSLALFCGSLKHLSVGWSSDLAKLNPLLDVDLDRLTKGCPGLEYLDISCSHCTNGSMESIARNCPGLTNLIVKQCFLQDAGLEHIGLGFPGLEWLDLTDCWYVSDVGLQSIANGCPRLRGVILTRCHEVRGPGAVKVALTCLNLENFVLKQCLRVDDHAIECIGMRAKSLRYLDVSYNQSVSVETVRKLRQMRGRELRIVTKGCPRVPREGAISRFPFSKADSAALIVWETAV